MPDFIEVPDLQVAPDAVGAIRYDLRHPEASAAPRPALVLVGGMTQTISSWAGQLRPLSATRTVMAYEARGQGSTRLALDDASLSRHVQDAVHLVEALKLPTPLDWCGFSFGARVCLAIAATRPDVVRRVVLTGIALQRTVLSGCIIEGWKAALKTGDLEALARISLSDIVGPDYLEAHGALVEPMIKAVITRNTYAGISALFRDTMSGNDDAAWTNAALAAQVARPGLLIGGAQDRVAPSAQVRTLAATMGAAHRIFEGSGHTVPIEAAEPWRRALTNFLDAAQPTAEVTVSHGVVQPGHDPAEDSLGP